MHCRHGAILVALSWAVGLAVASVFNDARAEEQDTCLRSGVTVVYGHPAELDMACRAVSDVVEYFGNIGFKVTLRGALRFVDRGTDRFADHGSAHGYFDVQRSQVVVYRTSEVSPWGLPWTSQLARSFLRHELVHMAIWEIIDGDRGRLRREWHEFIAHAVQLDLMEPQSREKVLVAQPQVGLFEHLTQVNEFTSGMNSDGFAAAAYKTYLARGSGTFVGKLLRTEIVPPPLSFPFPVLQDQAPSR